MTELDQTLEDALHRLNSAATDEPLDFERYRVAFELSAQRKAEDVLKQLDRTPGFSDLGRPIYVSIGGADGAEAAALLQRSPGQTAILIEHSRELANAARTRELPDGKQLEVFEGDASKQISSAVHRSKHLISESVGDYRVVTCHAVIHELFDRGEDFDPLAFFGTIFSDDDISTWFTYREPGIPEKWPDEILLSAGCDKRLLLRLSQEIQQRHAAFQGLTPQPQIVGDSIRLNSPLGMETIIKLLYLEDLTYEIQERSTAVDHRKMVAFISLAIGTTATEEQRAGVTTESAPTQSFLDGWRKLGVHVQGVSQDGSTTTLPIPENQTRVVAWRIAEVDAKRFTRPEVVATQREEDKPDQESRADVLLARDAFTSGDDDLLLALLLSKGRSWIELRDREQVESLLDEISQGADKDTLQWHWCHYLIGLIQLFSGTPVDVAHFSEAHEASASHFGLGRLFRAERMEFSRKRGAREQAIKLANSLMFTDEPNEITASQTLAKYVAGTVHFVLNNFLRSGGLYDAAQTQVRLAEDLLQKGIESHETELAHCHYVKLVCDSVRGLATFSAELRAAELTQRFAGALIQLSYSNAAWFVGETQRARRFASIAASEFKEIATLGYLQRAETVIGLITAWESLESCREPDLSHLEPSLARQVAVIAGLDRPEDEFLRCFRSLRPSVAAGLLQFRKFSERREEGLNLQLPPLLERVNDRHLKWREPVVCDSLEGADQRLRDVIGSPAGVRIPLYPD